jgi:8-oxo-dGTP pyrophosphatase MutT (NUDIX family)
MSAQFRQHVPRPPSAHRGSAPRWLGVDAARRAHVSVERVRDAFVSVRSPEFPAGSADAAVLVPITEVDGEANVLLIRRSDELETDPGHIAFPGGHVESAESALDAALRESEEEIGLSRSDVEVIGAFPALGRRRVDERVVPFIAVVRGRPVLTPDPIEVAEILEVPLGALAADGASWQEVWELESASAEMTFFAGIPELRSELIWGLSARILSSLLARVLLGTE